MSEVGNQAAATPAPVALTDEQKAVEAFKSRWEKRNYVLARSTDNLAAFSLFVDSTFDDTNPYKDWASAALPKLGENPSFAMVQSDNGSNRLIAIANKDEVFGTGVGNDVIKEAAYRFYCNKLMNAAAKDDAEADTFASVDGAFKARFDLSAFKELAKDMVAFLHKRNLKSMTVNGLRNSLKSTAYATSMFPSMKAEQWKIIFSIFFQTAEEKQLDTSVFTHWQNTRDAVSADTATDDFTMDDFFKANEEDAEETVAAPATPTVVPATATTAAAPAAS